MPHNIRRRVERVQISI